MQQVLSEFGYFVSLGWECGGLGMWGVGNVGGWECGMQRNVYTVNLLCNVYIVNM